MSQLKVVPYFAWIAEPETVATTAVSNAGWLAQSIESSAQVWVNR